MKDEFEKYCWKTGTNLSPVDERSFELEIEPSPRWLSAFLAESPLDTSSADVLEENLQQLVPHGRFRLVDSENWRLEAEPIGGMPPQGGMLKLTFRF